MYCEVKRHMLQSHLCVVLHDPVCLRESIEKISGHIHKTVRVRLWEMRFRVHLAGIGEENTLY